MGKTKVGVIGATGTVGQIYIRLLEPHPWFEVSYVAASPRSAGKTYAEAVKKKWRMDSDIPPNLEDLIVHDANVPESAIGKCQFIFSAINMDKEAVRELENRYAALGIPVVSNNSAHRWTPDVPVLIPEINPEHLDIIPIQRKNRGWNKGFVVVKPNCSVQSYITPMYALRRAGYDIREAIITTMQAVSGGGYPGVPSLDILGNVVPYIPGEEEKSEKEPHKIFGHIEDSEIFLDDSIRISANCNRVPVQDGHLACVNMRLGDEKPSMEEIIYIWDTFSSLPQELGLPSAPERPIIYLHGNDRPQPAKDRGNGKAMSVTVGRLQKDNVFDYKFAGLSHNTVRGAAGGGILNAELLKSQGYLD